MLENIPRISVLIITYNQEDVISRAIESLLPQKDYIYEICVSDDCSKDKTWDILQMYSTKYPGLFHLNRNDSNVGIFENIEHSFMMPSGDIIYQLAGDDECVEGWFKKVVDFIANKKIDYKKELFCIYGDFKCIYPNGDFFIFKNNIIETGKSPIKLSIRKLIGNKSCCFSINILKKFLKVSQGRSQKAEMVQDLQLQIYTDNNYYISSLGNIYYARIGISLQNTDDIKKERIERLEYLLRYIDDNNISIDTKDRSFLMSKYYYGLGDKSQACYYWIKSLDVVSIYPIKFFKRLLFAVLRRFNHHGTLSFNI